MNRAVHAVSLPEVLAHQARVLGEKPCFTLYEETISYRALWERSLRAATQLARMGIGARDKVAILLPTSAEFFECFYGLMALGAIPVPLYPILGVEEMAALFADSEAKAAITVDWFLENVERARARCPGLTQLISPYDLTASAESPALPQLTADDVGLIQYTSGSTGHPKGVVLTNGNLLANIRAFVGFTLATPDEVVVSWLPLYHDMGLIGLGMGALYAGVTTILLPPDLKDPRPWLDAIAHHRATVTASPDFGYRNCLRHLSPSESFDLRSLRMAFTGAEPIRLSTIQAFETRFGLQNVTCPCYGLAEATLAVTIVPPGSPLRVDPSGRFVSVGPPLPGIEVKIRAARAVGEEGEILVRSPGVMQGYYRKPEATREVLRDGWLHTGDLGFLDAEGYLYVTGRKKTVIVVAGRNFTPRDFEEIVDQFPEVRYSATVGIDSERLGTERIIVVAEIRDEAIPPAEASRLVRAIVAEIHEHQGLRPGQVLLVRKGGIPKTTSGKIQHARLIELLGDPDFGGKVVYPRRDSGGT